MTLPFGYSPVRQGDIRRDMVKFGIRPQQRVGGPYMSPSNERPGAGDAGANRYSRSDAVPTTRNQPAAQTNLRSLLDAALSFNIRVGAAPDGSELLAVIPMRVPREISRWFEHELSIRQHEIVDYILKANTGGRS